MEPCPVIVVPVGPADKGGSANPRVVVAVAIIIVIAVIPGVVRTKTIIPVAVVVRVIIPKADSHTHPGPVVILVIGIIVIHFFVVLDGIVFFNILTIAVRAIGRVIISRSRKLSITAREDEHESRK